MSLCASMVSRKYGTHNAHPAHDIPSRNTIDSDQQHIHDYNRHTHSHTHTMAPARSSKAAAPRGWAHTPSTPLLLWLGVSLPLVAWDTAYMLLRPLTMPGGSLHWPLWVPYALYGEVDHMYGFKQWHLGNPFAAAGSLLNLLERAVRAVPGAVVVVRAAGESRGEEVRWGGGWGATALLGFSAAVMTVSKTILYCEFAQPGWCLVSERVCWTGADGSTQGSWSTARVGTTSARTTSTRSSSCGSSPSKATCLTSATHANWTSAVPGLLSRPSS